MIGDFFNKTVDWLRFQYNRLTVPQCHAGRIALIAREHRPARVAFMAMSVPMWRYERLLEALLEDGRFQCVVVLSPSISYDRSSRERDLIAMREYFDARGIGYIDYDEASTCDIKHDFDPDIVFFPQPYEHLLTPLHDCTNFYDRLVCYYPYGFWTSTGKWSYDFHFHNLAWRLYYSTSAHLDEARVTARNHGTNVRVVGYPNADDFLQTTRDDPWHSPSGMRKRLIWAPHYAITDKFGLSARSNFVFMSSLMLQLAREHVRDLHIAFKPHPRLLTELYAHPDWGRERADEYYRQWTEGENTQLETGEYVDLFMTSDAMIHDSGSFAVEYLYSGCPVMFVCQDMNSLLQSQSALGREAYGVCYLGKSVDDIKSFVVDTVLRGDDPMKEKRKAFFDKYLLSPNGKTVVQNTVDDLVSSLGLSS